MKMTHTIESTSGETLDLVVESVPVKPRAQGYRTRAFRLYELTRTASAMLRGGNVAGALAELARAEDPLDEAFL